MTIADNEKLMNYLKKAIEVETDIAIQERILNEYESTTAKKKPVLKLRNTDSARMPQSVEFDWLMAIWFAIPILLCIWGLLMIFNELVVMGLVFFLPSAIWLFKMIKAFFIDDKKDSEEKWKVYYEEMSKIEAENKRIKSEYDEGIEKWNTSYEENRKYLRESLQNAKIARKQVYSQDIIYPKYRNLPALTSICEYLVTGRCTELTGPHGAYNLYEDEVRKDMVISQLYIVIENLESIKNNQYMLYEQVKSIRQNTDAMVCELRKISGYTFNIMQTSAISAYYSQITAKYSRGDFWHDVLF